ncbi:DinB family protein [Paenibacillus sp. LMG 31460]|uniref:DinB family protein n=1 Tax=Paenibacillus germinis TaxID=2654979 RepID=A0ABX1YY27_9BACL|nr:DinB family protein [Paenibacillus germinis]NOU86038.1 DinB family protein [Paenibacillus germinis]
MNGTDLVILNLEEVRRRSIKVWSVIPLTMLDWRPDAQALSIKEMIRHILDSEHYYHLAILNSGSLSSYDSPFDNREFSSVEDELIFAQMYREQFLNTVKSFTPEDLSNIKINRSDVGYVRTLGDMLMRIAYHESVHTGQLLDYMRTAGIDRPRIWD